MTRKRYGSMQPFKNSHLSTSSNNCKLRSQMKKVKIFVKLYEHKEIAMVNVTIPWNEQIRTIRTSFWISLMKKRKEKPLKQPS